MPANTNEYIYDGKTWTPCPTTPDGNCFFHALFGESTELNGGTHYFDKHAKFRRLYWVTFLLFFQHEDMPNELLDTIEKCFVANDNFQGKYPSDPSHFEDYVKDVYLGEHWVFLEEIPLLCTLWNVKVVLFLDRHKRPKIFEPNPRLWGRFPFGSAVPLRQEVIRLTNNHFEKLSVESEPDTTSTSDLESKTIDYVDFDTDEETEELAYAQKKKYKKGGSAGILGGFYQIDVITMVLLNAVKKCKAWTMSTENQDAGKFDDLILESTDGDTLLQAKHKEDKRKFIGYDALMSTTSSDFSLPKYFVSFQDIKTKFKIKNLVICTNANLQTDKKMEGLLEEHTANEDSVLHFEGVPNKFYTFTEAIITDLRKNIEKYHAQNIPNTKMRIADEDIREYLAHMRFFPNFMNKENFDNVIGGLVPSLSLAQGLDIKNTFNHVHTVISDWFKSTNGRYLSKLEAKALLCDIRSNNLCDTLKYYDISFQIDSFPLNFKKILHIITPPKVVMSLLKVYQVLQKNGKDKALFLNPNDTVAIHKQVVQVFSIPRYTFLVIVQPFWGNEEVVRRMFDKITKRLDDSENKKVIVIAEAENELARHVKSSKPDMYEEMREDVRFRDLTEEDQERLKKKKYIVFQGIDMTLEELAAEDLDAFVDTEVLEKFATDSRIAIGSEIKYADKNIKNYYISRTLQRNKTTVDEDQFRHLQNFQDRIILISDSAGMGKTTVLSNLAVGIKANHPSSWVVRIDLNNQASTFKAALRNGSKSIRVADLLADQIQSDLAKKLFLKRDNVVLMLDAVDEVSSSQLKLVMGMMAEAKTQNNFAKIFVTTRPHLCKVLEQRLEVAAFTMRPFSAENQVDFLTRYWTQALELRDDNDKRRCKKYAQALIDEMARWIVEGAENTFAGIPLQTRMLAEVFQEKKQLDDDQPRQWEQCKEFLSSDRDCPLLPKKINLIQLYELFVEKKRDIFVDVKGNTEGNALTEQALTDKFDECHDFHRNMALRVMFYPNECEYFTCFRSSEWFTMSFVDDYVLRAGIAQKVDGRVNFIHRTFAEYFAAECLVLELTEGNVSEDFQEFLLEEILIRDEYFVVRAFFDSFVQKELSSIPDDALAAFRHVDYISVLNHSRNSYLHLFAQEGSVGTMEFFIACVNFGITEDEELEEETIVFVDATDMDRNTPLHIACAQGHLNVVTALVTRGADVNFENVNGDTPLHAAALAGHLEVVEYLVDGARANLSKVNSYQETALLSATRKGNLRIVKFLVKRGMGYVGEYTTALHIACSGGNLDIVKYLVRKADANTEARDVNDCTPLHSASHEGHLAVVKYLVRNGCNINAVNRRGNTAFHDAASRGLVYLVAFFIKNGADTQLVDEDGYNIIELIDWLKRLAENEERDEREEVEDRNDENEVEDGGEGESENLKNGKGGNNGEDELEDNDGDEMEEESTCDEKQADCDQK